METQKVAILSRRLVPHMLANQAQYHFLLDKFFRSSRRQAIPYHWDKQGSVERFHCLPDGKFQFFKISFKALTSAGFVPRVIGAKEGEIVEIFTIVGVLEGVEVGAIDGIIVVSNIVGE